MCEIEGLLTSGTLPGPPQAYNAFLYGGVQELPLLH